MLLTAIGAFVTATWLARSFANPRSRLHILDHPNERSLHSTPTPRTGGVAIVTATYVSGLVLAVFTWPAVPHELLWLGLLGLPVAAVSYLDDRWRHVPVGIRLVAHGGAAVLLVIGGLAVQVVRLPGFSYELPGWFGAAVTVLFVVWMINLYNFMDGMDGFAGGMTVFGFGALALLGWWAGEQIFASVNLVVAAAASGFLLSNFPPAKIFMGDTGSSTLGFLAAGMSLWAERAGIVPLWIAVLMFSPFIVDATVTLVRRLLRGQRVWQAHKTHYYQRLVQLGWGHRKTVLVEYGIMGLCVSAGLVAFGAPVTAQWLIVAGVTLVYVVFFGWVRKLEGRGRTV
jgi:UDP-N-acetylmuramyl pentapeptide phosphotransferase/UDP-N-acetylglucosamine-1-phosphate transferase